LFATNVYRAVTQSVEHDEGVTYVLFLSGPFSDVWTKYNANNHILNSFLCRISTGVFGLSEFTLRLPSLLGGALYFVAAYRLMCATLRDGPPFLLGVSLLSLNPFVLDYLSAARGYGMGSAFLLWAIYFSLQLILRDFEKRTFWKLGLSAGLAVGANLTLVFPITALGMVMLAFFWFEGRSRLVRTALVHAAAPALLTMLLIYAAPGYYAVAHILAKQAAKQSSEQSSSLIATGAAARRSFYAGAPSLRIGFESLVRASFFRELLFAGASTADRMSDFSAAETLLIVCVVMVAVGYGTKLIVYWLRKRELPPSPAGSLLMVVSATIVAALGGVLISHYVFKYPYPELRTGLYWIPIATLGGIALAAQVGRSCATFLSLVFVGFVIQYAAEFQTHYYVEWRYSSAARPIAERIRSLAPKDPTQTYCIGGTWLMEPSLNFYRDMFQITWLAEVQRQPAEESACDFYVLLYDDRLLVEKRQLRTLLDDPVSGAILAITPSAYEVLSRKE
jgi:hypothetical protein